MKKNKFWSALSLFRQGLGRAHISIFAASSAFYLFLSLVPLVMLFLGLLPFTSLTQGMILQPLLSYAPEQFQQLIHNIVAEVYDSSLSVLSLSLIAELWSASKFFACLARGVGEIYEGYQEQGFFRLRLHGILYTGLLILFVVLDFSIVVFGKYLIHIIGSYFPYYIGLWEAFLNLRGLIFIAYLTFYNAMLFASLPRKNLKFRQQLPGAAFSAIVWFVFSKIYAILIDIFHFFGIYGNLTMIIISLVWIYYSMYILYLGAYLNAFLLRYKPGWWQKRFNPARGLK
ncbi:YihY/virulence factor BrkB family protein [Oscillospiraceae bacterium LTW-04]|nr:YihY/virulence factor BrkB family protein [Oscillospiraceae bacterium MB24-C1]